jgi:hypothetical protein
VSLRVIEGLDVQGLHFFSLSLCIWGVGGEVKCSEFEISFVQSATQQVVTSPPPMM